MNKNLGIFYVASLSLLLLASTVAIPMQAFAETPDTVKFPVIILFNDKVSNQHKSLVQSHGGEVTRTFTIINGVAANLPQNAIDALENNPSIISIDPDMEVRALEENANGIVGATVVQSTPISKTGNGITVAILDTGIDLSHQEFNGKLIDCKSVFSTSPTGCNDGHGHGTHVAGIVGANGAVSAAIGVAPDVDFIIYKVLDDSGSGSFSGIITAMEYVVNDGGLPKSKIISMSLGSSPISPKNAPNCDGVYPSMDATIAAAKAAGVTVVAAAGNSGNQGVGLPACISDTIAVAATNDSDNIASFSSRGGSVQDHGISAPGVSIYSSLPGNSYASWSGTSMATPVVSGSIALLLSQDSTLTPNEIKDKLFNTACNSTTSPSCPTGDTPNKTYGYGRIDVLSAYNSLSLVPSVPIVNDPLTATVDSYNTQEDTMLNVVEPGILTNDLDPQSDPLTAVLDSDVTDGTLVLNADGSFSYDPDLNFNGVDSFTYHASDGTNYSNTVIVTITVTPVNDLPVVNDDSATTPEGTQVEVFVLDNDSDVEASLTITSITQGTNGFVSTDGTTTTYSPNGGFTGSDSYTYTVTDSDGATDTATVLITVESHPVIGTGVTVVDPIDYATSGGKDGDRHLTNSVFLNDDLGNGVSGADVGIMLINTSTTDSWTATATTDENGRVSFTLKNAPTGCYKTDVISVNAAGLTWDESNPATQFGLRAPCP